MELMKSLRRGLALAGLLLPMAFASPAPAAQADIDLLASYVGSWQGTGRMSGGDSPEDFTCRLTVAQGSPTKINYTGRCTLVSLNLAVNGTILYNDDARRYEGAMSSNAGFSGLAIGRRTGSTIVFDLKERNPDREGQDITIGSKITLSAGRITVDFDVTFNDSGTTMKTSVPFTRR